LRWVEEWMKLLMPAPPIVGFDKVVIALDDITAREYVESDRLNLESLTSRGKKG